MPTTPQRLGLPHWTVICALTLSSGFASGARGNFYISSMQTFSDITFDFSPEAYDCAILPPDAVVKPTESPPTAPTTTGASPSEPKSCNFEEDFCNWNVDFGLNDTEAFVFKRSKGELQDGEHGPSWDHDRSKTSYFLWADAASGNPDTLTAISSPQFSTTKPFCFTFWFDLTVSNQLSIKEKA